MTLHDAVVRHASLLCEQELRRRKRAGPVRDASRDVTLAVARWLADAATSDETVRNTLEAIYLRSDEDTAIS